MNKDLTPKWMKTRAQEEDNKRADEEYRAAIHAEGQQRIFREGPVFWKSLSKELYITAQSLESIEARGVFSSTEEGKELNSRIEIVKGNLFPKIGYTNLFYVLGSGAIRCVPLKGKSFNLSFCFDDEKNLRVIADTGTSLMDAEVAAQFITENLLDSL